MTGAGLGKIGQIRYHLFRDFLHIRGINSWIQQSVYFWLSVFQPCYALVFGHSGNSRKSLNKLTCGKSFEPKRPHGGLIPGGLILWRVYSLARLFFGAFILGERLKQASGRKSQHHAFMPVFNGADWGEGGIAL